MRHQRFKDRDRKRRSRPSTPPPQEPAYFHPSRPSWLFKSPYEVPLVFFDFETTGGNPHNSGITEIAAIKYVNGQEVGRFQTLVNPERPIPRMVQKITGIDNAMVRNAPRISEVFDEFVAFIGDGVLISHGAIGDVAYISHNFRVLKEATFQNYYVCTHLLVANFLPNIPSKTLGGVASYFNIPPVDVHRAMADAELTAGVFWKIYEVCDKHSYKTIEDLLKIQADNETLRRLGSGVLLAEVEERAPNQPGIFYLFNPAREIVFMSAAQNLKKRMMRVTELGEEREFNRLITDVVDFKIERTSHFLGALLREREVLSRLNLPIDPRKFEGRSPGLIQVVIPDDLLDYAKSYSRDLPLDLPEAQIEKLDMILPDPSQFPGRKLPRPIDEDDTPAAKLEPVPIRKTRKTVLGASVAKYKMLRTLQKARSEKQATSAFSIGSLVSGCGWYFGPFDPARNPRKHFDDLLNELPFQDENQPVEARMNYLHLFVSALFGKLDVEIASVNLLKNKPKYLFRPIQRYRLSQLADRLRLLQEQRFDLPLIQLPRTGLAVLTNSTAKEFDVYVVVRGTVRKELSLMMEDSDKLKSPRFITRLFHAYDHEIANPLQPQLFTDDLCSDIELFAYWMQNRRGEGEWIDFSEIESLYNPELL